MFRVGCTADNDDIIEYIKQNKKVSKETIWKLFYHDGDDKVMFTTELEIMVDKSKAAYANDKKNGITSYYIDYDGEFYSYKK